MTLSQPQPRSPRPSPLMLSDRLLTLAQDADLAGCAITAEHLVALAHSVFEDEAPRTGQAVRHVGSTRAFRPIGGRPAIFARLPAPVSGLALQAGR